MRACARVALVLMAMSASFGLTGCGPMNDLKDAVSRWFDIGKSPGGRGLLADDLPDAPPKDCAGENDEKGGKQAVKEEQAS
jgi:hypothetical protein